MQNRPQFLASIQEQLSIHPVCGLLGPRQCGKTTLAKEIVNLQKADREIHVFDLEIPQDSMSLSEPMRALEKLKGLVIIDEVQRAPEIFPVLRVLVDRHPENRYLILGSASRDLIKQSSESLAGRIGYVELTPFHASEGCQIEQLLIRGGFPRSYLAPSDSWSYKWRESYIQTFLERDLPALGFQIPPMTLRRFWMMLAHVHGQLLNLHDLSTALGVSGHTIRRYVDILTGTFMVRVMVPWFENIQKRQIKTPKLFFRDNGLLLTLLSIKNESSLRRHPKLGAIWEGFALEQIIQSLALRPEEVFFWRTHNGIELDLLIFHEGERWGFEFKYADAPTLTKSMHQSLNELKLDRLYVIYPGERQYDLHDKISVMGLSEWVRTLHTT